GELALAPFVPGAAVTPGLARRLARKLCTHCCEADQPTKEELLESRVSSEVAAASDGAVFYRKKGCPRCNHTGFRGRIGLFQLLRVSEEVAAVVVRQGSRHEIAKLAIGEGRR